MFTRLFVLVALVVPSLALAQYADPDEVEGEGTYSTYSGSEARVQLDAEDYAEPVAEQAPEVSQEQELFNSFYNELARWGRWEVDTVYGWIWRPVAMDFRPYANGWWTYTDDGWTFESDDPFGWAVYHYGRWAYLSGAWAWIPGYEWSPAWVTMRVTDDSVGWAPLGPAGLTYEWMPMGWGYSYSPWIFVYSGHFGRRFRSDSYLEHRYGQRAFHTSRSVSVSAGGAFHHCYKEIPSIHHAAPIHVVEGRRPEDVGGPRDNNAVVVYRPRPHLGTPTVGAPAGGGGRWTGRAEPSRPGAPDSRPRPPTVFPGPDRTVHVAGPGPAPSYQRPVVSQPAPGRYQPPHAVTPAPSYTRPASQPSYTRPASQPTYTRPASQPTYTRPASQPTYTRPASQPSYSRPATQPSYTRPASQPSYSRPASQPSQPVHSARPAVPAPVVQPAVVRPSPSHSSKPARAADQDGSSRSGRR